MEGIKVCGNTKIGETFLNSLEHKNFLFSLVISYTQTCEIPGITFAGSDPSLLKYTSPADAEFLHYGYCKSIQDIPMTPDGKPTPALLTKVALESASIPHVVINAGSKIKPQLPYIDAQLPAGKNITQDPAMIESDFLKAIDYGRIIGRTLSSVTDCLVIGESIPGGTTTALAVMRGLGIDAKVSSSMPQNPVDLKEGIVSKALKNIDSKDPFAIAATLGDPMIPVVAGMVSAASEVSKVILAGGTQMAGVLSFGRSLGFKKENLAIGATSYVANDESANFVDSIRQIADIPVLITDPMLDRSKIGGLRAFSEGFAKEGVGAGGSMIASTLKTRITPDKLFDLIEKEYLRIFT